MDIQSHPTLVSNIPVIELFSPIAAQKLPLLILMHGFTGSKRDLVIQAQAFAQQSYYAVTVDLHRHGELGEKPFIPARVSPYLDEVIERSAENIDRLLAAYAGNPAVDAEHVCLLGVSLGGAVIYRYLPRRSSAVRAAACMVAGCDTFWEKTFRSVMQLYPDFGITEEWLEQAKTGIQNRPFLTRISDFPLLMQYGRQDPIIPIDEVRKVYAHVSQGYHEPDRIILKEYEGCGHETPPAMYIDALSWFQRWGK
jgi:uncharacterized protein